MLLIMLVSISAVVASDFEDVTTVSNDENLTVQSSSSEPVLEQSDNNDTNIESASESDGVLSASSDEDILGDSGTFYDLSNTINTQLGSGNTVLLTNDYKYTGGNQISISKNNVVIDGQGHTIDGNYQQRIFSLSGNNITLKNITFINAYKYEYSGGAISTSKSLTIINCTFKDNEQRYTYAQRGGGAIYIYGQNSVLTIQDSKFIGNHAYGSGGAIQASTTNGKVIISNSVFKDNYVDNVHMSNHEWGGGVFLTTANTILEIYSSNFTGNSANGTEGGVARHSGRMIVDGCYFEGNSAWDGGTFVGGNPSNSNSLITNCVFKNNYADRWGGALQERKSEIRNCTFINNTVNLVTESSDVSIDGPHGGAIYGRDYIRIYDSKFYDNQARKGGAIFFEKRATEATIERCDFKDNSAVQLGGAIYVDTSITVNILSSNFTKNHSPKGGAIYLHSANPGTLFLSLSNFIENWATVAGGAIYGSDSSVQIGYSTFVRNNASTDGGALYSKSLEISSSTFDENIAQDYGGAIYNYGRITLSQTDFNKNSAVYGGAIYTPCIKAEQVKLIENNAEYGGAIYAESSLTEQSSIDDSEFSRNNASYDGGAIYWNAAIANIKNTNFISNYAGNDAGAIFWKKGNGQIIRSTFTNNNAEDDAGAVYWDASKGQILNTVFENNYAKDKAGAVYWIGDFGYISTSTFKDNTVNTKGDAIYWYGNNGSIESSSFDGNHNFDQVYWHGGDGKLTQNTFNGAKSVYICPHASVTLTENTQTNNNYENYSVYNDGNASFKNNDFTNAIHNNGLILTETSVVVLDNRTIVTEDKYYDVYTAVIDDNGNYIKLANDLKNTFEGREYTATFNNTHYLFKTPYLELGKHPVSSSGDFAGLTINTLKSGILMYMILDINVTVINYGETVIINTTVVNTTENGTIDLVINGIEYNNITLSNGSAVLILHNVAPDTYTIDAYYDIFNQTIDNKISYNITLRTAFLRIMANNITAGQNNTIIINVTKGATGTVYVFVNNKMYTETLSDSQVQINLTNVAGGTYAVYAVYNGDRYYSSAHNDTQFTATKIKPVFTINATDRIIGQPAIIDIKGPADITGSIYVYIDNAEYVFTKMPISMSVPNLAAGNHSIRVVYGGNIKYLQGNASSTFKINKKDIQMVISTKDIKVGQDEPVTISTPDDAKGLILLTVNGIKYYVYANETQLIISNLAKGSYNLTATYQEDSLYNEKTVKSSFKVDYVSIDPKITYTVDDNLNAVINVTIPSDVAGDMLIEINNVNYTAYNIKGLATVTAVNLTGGSYSAKFYLKNDPKYGNVTKPFTVSLSKIDMKIHVDAPTIHVGDDAIITVALADDAEGNVTLTINNQIYVQNVTGGKAVFTIPNLPYGDYPVTAAYSGDRKYSSDNERDVLVVSKVDISPYTYITADQIFVGENATININMPDDAYGKVNLTIQNRIFEVNISNGHGQINISGLKYGVPVPIHAEYYGNEKYLPCKRDFTGFSVHRITNYDVEIIGKTNDTGANITVKIPSDANGPGYITINNKTYPVTFVNGEVKISVDGLNPGENYTVYAYFAGDDKYTANDAYKTLNSVKTLDYIFDVTAKDIVVGETAYLIIYLPNATNATDKITVKVPGQPEATVPLDLDNESIMKYPINNLPAGSYQISVTYHGNEKYDARSRYGNLSVSKINKFAPKIDVNTPYVGQNLTFNITLPGDAKGNVTVTVSINNNTYNATVINGTAYVVVPGLPEGKYNATVYYSGDDKYNNRTQIVDVEVLKIMDFTFNVGVSDIFVDQNETIHITLPEDIDGTVKITIDDTSYINETVVMNKGKGTFNAAGLAQGTYKVTATLNNDSKYADYTVIKTFKVSTIGDYIFNLHDVDEVKVRDNLTIIVDLPENAAKNATLDIFGKIITVEVIDGTATFRVPTTSDGSFPFTVSYEEEGKYDFKSLSGYAFVSKVDVVLNPEFKSPVGVDENVTFKVQLPEDATGNISLITRGITYSVKLVNGSGNLTILGYPLSSIYSPVLTYSGDDKYNPTSKTVSVNVIRVADYDLNVTVEDICYKQNEIVNITLPSDATDDVLISGNFSSRIYSVSIKNGNATFAIKDLLPGTYSINVRYQGYNKYEDKNVTKTFTVRKITPEITIDYVNDDTIVVNLPIGDGVVNITVNNDIYPDVEVIGGVATLDISGYLPGKYTINATFAGDERYFGNKTSKDITIAKIDDYTILIEAEDIIVGQNATIKITLPEHAVGDTVNITIDNGDIISVPVTAKVATYNAAGLKVGKHNVTASYAGPYYTLKTDETSFKVDKIKTVISSAVSGNATNIVINVTLNDDIKGGNVTIVVDNVKYNFTNIESNKINLSVPSLPREHDIAVTYSGDENHTDAKKSDYILTSKITDYTLIVEVHKIITVLERNVVNVTLPKGIAGEVSISVNGMSYGHVKLNSTTGNAILYLPQLADGNYTVVATFSNAYYKEQSNSTNFTVIKLNTTIGVNVVNITRDLDEIINISLNKNTGGQALVNVNGTIYYVDIDEGTGSLTLSNLNDGNYTVTVTYLGDNYYNSNSTTAEFTVSKIPIDLTISGNETIVNGQAANFIIQASRNITDLITVVVGNKTYTAVLYRGMANLTVPNLAIGKYNVTAIYGGDDYYVSANGTMELNVTAKKGSAVSVNVSSITVGDNLTIYVNVTEGATGIVSVVVEGVVHNVPLVNGRGNVTVENLTAGSYTVTAYYRGDSYYLTSNVTANFTVFKKKSQTTVNISNSHVGDLDIVRLTVTPGATGHVLLAVGGMHVYVDLDGGDNNLTINLTEFEIGEYNITATYTGDDNYYGSTANASFNVTKRAISINITSSDITYGQVETFIITMSANITEVVTININGVNQSYFVEHGKANFTVHGLKVGNYNVTVYFPGNTQYDSASNRTNFTVKGKIKPTMNVTVANITVGENITVYINATEGINDTVYVTIAGVAYPQTLKDGKVNFQVANLTARNYVISAFFMGNTYYEPVNVTSAFTVFKKTSSIKLNVTDISVGDVEVVNVTVDKGAKGYVLINIAGVHIYAEINNGTAVAKIIDLAIGKYNVTASYLGDENYLGNSTNGTFNVTKHKTAIVIKASNITVGQTVKFNITTSDNFTEVVTITIGNNNYTTFVKNGTGTFSINNLGVGNYTAYVNFPGNSKYDAVSNSTNFTVSPKKDSAVTINVTSIVIGDKLTVYVNVTEGTTGRITLTIAGDTYSTMLNNSRANFTFENLTARNYHVTAHYFGDEYYLESNASAYFVVNKKLSQINVTVANITVDQSAVLNITITNGTSGVVLIDINGTDYFADIKNGSAQLIVKNMAVGEYNVIVKYNGDLYYNGTENSTKFKVSKLPSEITVKVISSKPVALGNDVLINVTGPKDVTGVATVVVTTDGVDTPHTVYINNGEGLLIIKPHVGEYSVVASYIENYKYSANISNTDDFEVYANGTSLDVKSHNINVGDNETIIVTVAGNHTGNVTISIDNNNIVENVSLTYNSTSNSSVAKLVLDNKFAAGIHQVEATYLTNESNKLITHKGSSLFIVSKIKSAVVINPIANITVGQNVTISLNLSPSDATGNVTVYINGEKHILGVNNLTLTIPNLGAATYLVQARYDGDNKYEFSEDDKSFTVFKNNVSVKLNVSDITINQNENITVTLPSDAGGYVLININGTHYYAVISKGVANVTISDLTPGKYDVNVTFIGDNKYYANSTTGSFNVTKLRTDIVIKGSDIFIGQDEILNISTPANLTVVVIVEIDGKNYTSFIENGKGSLKVSNLNKTIIYTATVYFNGNNKYEAVSNHSEFTVRGKMKSSINVTVADITVGNNITVYVNATEGINDTAYITIAGVAYTTTLENGKASFQVANLTARNYTVSVFFMGNQYYEHSNSSSTFKVKKMDSTIQLNVTNINIGGVEVVNVTLPVNATGNVLISIGSIHVYAEIINGIATANITNLDVGKHNVTAKYIGDSKYNAIEANGTFNVTRLSTTIVIKGSNITQGQAEVLNITTSANITEVITIKINGIYNYTTFVLNGTGSITIYNLASDNYTAYAYFAGNTQYGAANNFTKFKVDHKKASAVNVHADNITVGQNATITVNVTEGATGYVTIVIAGNEYTHNLDADGRAVFTVENLAARDYQITAMYAGDTYHFNSSNKSNFTVKKIHTAIDVTVHDIIVGDNEMIEVNVTDGATGVILINITGTSHSHYNELVMSATSFDVAGLEAGNYTVFVKYQGDDKYFTASTSKTFTVHPEISVTPGTNNGNSTPLTIKISDDPTASGNATVIIDNQTYHGKVVNGTVTIDVNATPGKQNVTVVYSPDNGNKTTEQNRTVDIPKVTGYDVSVEAKDIKEGENATIKVKLPSDATGNVTIRVANKTIPAKVENGEATVSVADLPVGSHEINVDYDGDNKYSSTTYKSNINVKVNVPTIEAIDLVRGWNSPFDYEAVFLNQFGEVLANAEVNFVVNGKTYGVSTESHGIAKLNTSKLPIGEYKITAVNPVTKEQVTRNLKIVPRLINNKDITMDFVDGTYYRVLVIGDNGKPVSKGEIIDIYVNTIHYVSKTDDKGYASLKINLNPNKYTVISEYKTYKVKNKLTVKQTLQLVKKTVTVKKTAKKLVISAKLKWSNGKAIKGKKLVLKFRGKKYTAKTNAKGIAKFTINNKVFKNLKKGKKYSYSVTYISNIVAGKVTVK